MRRTLDILTLTIFFTTLAVYLPGNSLIESQRVKSNFISFFPQGWAFFTKNPQEIKTKAYLVKGESIDEFNKIGNRLKYATGLKRNQRILSKELSEIISSYSKQKNKVFFKSISEAIIGNPILISNNSIIKTLCGKVIVNIYKETPWVWFSNNIKDKPLNKYVHLEIKCG